MSHIHGSEKKCFNMIQKREISMSKTNWIIFLPSLYLYVSPFQNLLISENRQEEDISSASERDRISETSVISRSTGV